MFQQLIINNLVHTEDYMRKVHPFLRSSYFPDEGSRIVFGIIDTFINEFNSRPTVDAIAVQLEKMKLSEHVFDQAVDVIQGIETDVNQLEWLIKESESWVQDRALRAATEEAVLVYEGKSKLTPLELPDLFADALSICFDTDLGHDYWEMAAQHYDHMNQEDVKMPFTTDIMNRITRGGIPNKTLNICAAGINVGKTTWLIDRAAEWLEAGKNVVYFSFEVDQDVIRHRADVRLLDIPFERVEAMTKPEYLGHIEKLKEKCGNGRFKVKEYPSGGGHCGHMRGYLRELEQKEGFKADVIICDYLGEMASSRLPIHMMSNTNVYYGSVARELRSLGMEFDIPVWTAVQLTRGKQDTQDTNLSLADTADAISVPKVADFMITLIQPDELALINQARGVVTKNRYANKAKLKHFVIGLDNDRQKTYDVEWEQQEGVMSESEIEHAKSTKLRNETANGGSTVDTWEF